MKTLKSILFLSLLTLFSVTFTSCGGDEEDEPKPTKSNLELVKEGIVGNWEFVSSEITKDGQTLTYNGGCEFTGKPTWYQANAQDVNYLFTGVGASKHRNCTGESFDNFTYTITEQNGKFIVTVSDGAIFELITPPGDIKTATTVKAKFSPMTQGVTNLILTFTKQ
jgi:hypothetical protein